MTKTSRIALRVAILVLVSGVLAGGAVIGRKYQKQHAARKALDTGREAYAARQCTRAASDLGRYLTIEPKNSDVLMMYADAQIHRRPIKQGNIEQAITALEQVLTNPGIRPRRSGCWPSTH